MQAVHLEGIAGSAGQFGERVGDVLQHREIDVRRFWRAAVDCHVKAFFFTAGVSEFQCLLAIVVYRQVAHDLEQIAELGLE
ncbi:hypothetical protein D3C86_1825160 [compost metagenome]